MASLIVKCLFCSAAIEKDTGTAGAEGGICHSCTNRAAARLEAAPLLESERSVRAPKETVLCNFCFTSGPDSAVLFTRNGYFVCAKCIGLIRREIIERPLIVDHKSPAGIYPL